MKTDNHTLGPTATTSIKIKKLGSSFGNYYHGKRMKEGQTRGGTRSAPAFSSDESYQLPPRNFALLYSKKMGGPGSLSFG